ncbi:MAG: L,D-transpeptidase [Anaerolineae bacterium]|nr:L,D-transpeptidase [Anaerolineae bacterium]
MLNTTRFIPWLTLVVLLAAVPATLAQQICSAMADCVVGVGVSDAILTAYPQPNIRALPIDDAVLYDRTYRKVPGNLEIFDAPGGNLVDTTGSGFSYVTVWQFDGDWARIEADQWVHRSALSEDVLISRYAGVELPNEGLPYPMAWTLRHLRPALTPGGEASDLNPFLYRYTRVSLYTYVEVDGKRWYQIGRDQWVHQFDVAKITPIERPEDVDTDKWVGIDLYEQTLIAYEGDTPVFSTLISSGLKDWPTNEGLFHVYIRYDRTDMSGAYQQPDFYFLQEVPWTQYFDGDIAIHGTYWHDGFGYRHSHGCVNASITDARWLYDWAQDAWDFEAGHGISVYVYSSGAYDS